MDGEDSIVFYIYDRATGVCGYTWLIESHSTSFYIKSTWRPMQSTKVSIHGPDSKHIGKQHFRLDFTSPEEARKAVNAGGGWGAFGQSLPIKFTGRPVNKRTVHLARFSAGWDMFRPGMQRGPDPTTKAKATLHAALAAPNEGSATHVDLYVSTVRPFWQNREREIRRADAGMGPLINRAGMYMTAVVTHRRATREPDPFGNVSQGLPHDQCIRGIAEAVDTATLLWICEKMIPRTNLAQVQPPPRGVGAV